MRILRVAATLVLLSAASLEARGARRNNDGQLFFGVLSQF